MVAGQDYIYAMRGDGRTPLKWESATNQRKALDALAGTLKPSELTVPKQVLDAIPHHHFLGAGSRATKAWPTGVGMAALFGCSTQPATLT